VYLSSWITIKNYLNELPIVDGTGLTLSLGQGIIDIGPSYYTSGNPQTSYITFDGFKVINSASDAIHIRYSHNITIQNCWTMYTKMSGIRADNGVEWPNHDPTPIPSNIHIYNNTIQYSRYPSGAQESMSLCRITNFEVKYNTLDSTNTNIGIDMKNACYKGVVAYNDVSTPANNIYVDVHGGESYDINIYNNYCHGSGIGLKIGSEDGGDAVSNIKVYNNIFVNGEYNYKYVDVETGDHSGVFDGISFINNVFVSTSGMDNLRLYPAPATGNNYYTDMVIRNNIFKGGIAISVNSYQPVSELTIDHNFFADSSDIYGANYLRGDPQWVNPSAGDYHLQSTSPAIEAGSYIDAPSVDFDGNLRPQGNAVDIGAYEYGSGNNQPTK